VQGNGKGTPDMTAACIDAETLAAWADGGLSKSDAAAVETHLSDCERCTAMLATFARTIPETAVAESLWKRWHLRWLVPAATAATVAALWVLVPRPESPQNMTLGRAPSTELQAPASPDPTLSFPQPATAADAKEQEAPPKLEMSNPTDALKEAPRAARRPAPEQLTDERRADSNATASRPQGAAANETFAAAPSPAREADRQEAKSADQQSERFSPPVPSANAATAPAPSVEAPSAPAAPVAPAAGLSAASAARQRAIARPDRDFTLMFEIVSPNPTTRWRVISTGQVERSTNGGARWERATLPEATTLTGGSSPSPSICWLVGRTGSIYVTTDGLRFVRVPFPDRSDFVSIQATDGRRATVVTIDGRTMRTDDQGANWIRLNP
jgi:hypothetical protein